MDKDNKKQIPPQNDEFDALLEGRALKENENYNIDDFISAPTAKSAGEITQGEDSALSDFIAKPDAEEDRGDFIATMHPELLQSIRGQQESETDSYASPKGVKTALKIIIPIFICLLAALFFYFKLSSVGSACDKEYSTLYETILEKGAKRFSYLKGINNDTVGFINFGDVGYPVVKPQENNEEYYKSHLFSGKSNRYGTLYTNSNIEANGFPEVTAIYGSGTDSRMLGNIKKYQKSSKQHTLINFDSLTDNGVWVLFSAFDFKDEEPFLLDRISFLNEDLQNEYINNFYNNSSIEYHVDAVAGDKFLVLIANDNNRTHVAAFRLLREGENEDNITPRIIETITEKVDSEENTSTIPKESAPSSTTTSSKQSTTSGAVKEPTTQTTPTINTEKRYEQTGLTTDMDKTVKVDVAPVVKMSNVVGMTKAAAVSLLEDTLGFPVKIVEQESTEKRGNVIAQSVAGGAEISTDNTVTITVSIGLSGGKTLMPDLIGFSKETAEIILNKYELRLSTPTEEKSALEKGTIISQSIAPNTEIAVNTIIDIVVSDGKGELKTVKMPNIIGKTQEEASTAIKAVGLKVGKIITVTSSKPAGTVISQEVPKNQPVAQNEAVGFSISNGSKVNNLTVKNLSSWSVTINGKSYAPGAYIKGDYMDIIPYIVEAEMGGGFNTEALKAQAVAAYCWLINAGSTKGSAPAVPLKNPTQKAIDAAAAVNGQKVIYKGETAQTYYYAISAGSTANCKDVWYADIPYLRAVDSSVDKDYNGFETKVTYSASDLKSRVNSTYGVDLSGISKSKWFSVTYDENDAYARKVSIGGKKEVTGSSFRDQLLDYELRSTAFKIKYNKSKDTFTFTVRGFGHGVGMSQVGANYYAAMGWTYSEILAHYYPGTTLG